MPLECAEVKNFIGACEKIQALLAQGRNLKEDERDVIQFCIEDLLIKLRASPAAV